MIPPKLKPALRQLFSVRCGTKFFGGRDGALRRPDGAARRPYQGRRRILSCALSVLIPLAAACSAPAADSGYVRFLPNDGNNVYPASGLLRQWPAEGPKELWRATIGDGKSAVIEAGGRAFTAAQAEGKQWAVCLDPATGKTLWKTMLATNENHHQVDGTGHFARRGWRPRLLHSLQNDNGDIYKMRCPVFCLRAGDGSEVWSEGEEVRGHRRLHAADRRQHALCLLQLPRLHPGGGGQDDRQASLENPRDRPTRARTMRFTGPAPR